jgi:hypothetical protein
LWLPASAGARYSDIIGDIYGVGGAAVFLKPPAAIPPFRLFDYSTTRPIAANPIFQMISGENSDLRLSETERCLDQLPRNRLENRFFEISLKSLVRILGNLFPDYHSCLFQ